MNRHELLVQKLKFQDVWYELTIKPMIEKERLDNSIFYSSMSYFVEVFNKKFTGLMPIRYSCREDFSMIGVYPRYIHTLKSQRWERINTNRSDLFYDLIRLYTNSKPVIKLLFDSFEDCKERFKPMLDKGENIFLSKYVMEELIND